METPRCRGKRAVVYDLAGATAMGGTGQSQMDIYHTVRKHGARGGEREREFGGNSEERGWEEEEKR